MMVHDNDDDLDNDGNDGDDGDNDDGDDLQDWLKSQLPTFGRYWSGLTSQRGNAGWLWENPGDQDPVMTQKLV